MLDLGAGVLRSGSAVPPRRPRRRGGAGCSAVAVPDPAPAPAAAEHRLDVIIPATHGTQGEDGCLQGALELADIPYAGPTLEAAVLAMNKAVTKSMLRAAGIPVVDDLTLRRSEYEREGADAIVARVKARFGLPVFAKPASLGSSVGVKRCTTDAELADALQLAFELDRLALVEPAVEGGMEINCAVLGRPGAELRVSVTEQPLATGDVLTFEDKYLPRDGAGKDGGGLKNEGMAATDRMIPAPISDELTERVYELSRRTFAAIGGTGVARVDLLLDAENRLFVNEPNTIPGSFAFYLWEPAGLELPGSARRADRDRVRRVRREAPDDPHVPIQPAGDAGQGSEIVVTGSRVAVAAGGTSIEREVSLRGARRVAAALRQAGDEVARARDRPFDPRARPRPSARLRVHRRPRPQRRGRVAAGAAGAARGAVHRLRQPRQLALHRQGGDQAAAAARGAADAAVSGLQPPHVPGPRRRGRVRRRAATARHAARRQAGAARLVVRDQVRLRRPSGCAPSVLGSVAYDDEILVEQHVAGRELAVTVLAGADGQPRALPIVEILSSREFYDYEAHYDFDVVSLDAPATLEPAVAAEVERVSIAAFRDARLPRLRPRRPDARRRRPAADPGAQHDPRPDRDRADAVRGRGRRDELRRARRGDRPRAASVETLTRARPTGLRAPGLVRDTRDSCNVPPEGDR